jgi:hypothetical protein
VNQHNTSEKPRGRFRRLGRWFLWSLLILFVLLAICGVYLTVNHSQAVDRLAAATAEQDANHPGWRLEDIEAARAAVPDDENGILIVLATAKLLPPEWSRSSFEFPKRDADPPPNWHLTAEERNRLRVELESVNPARAEARKLATRSTGRYPLAYQRNPLSTLVPHAQDTRVVTHLLRLDALLRMDAGDCAAAAVSCRAAFNAGRAIGDEPLAISQLVRLALFMAAGEAVERLLAQGELSDEELASLQHIVEEEAEYPGFRVACRGERAMVHLTVQAVVEGEIPLDVEGNGPTTWSERCWTLPARDVLRRRQAEAFPMLNKMVELGEAPPHLRAVPLQEFRAMVQAQPKLLPRILVEWVPRLENAFTRRDAYLACLAAALAAERHRREHGEWPPSLEALAPQYLSVVPLDPSDGQPVRYAKREDGVVIYSAVADGKGQVFNLDRPSPPGEGIAVRLWDADRRGKSD